MAKLLYQGHASFRITTDAGKVIYVDPYVGEGYDLPAHFILVTHQHGDHNKTGLVKGREGCVTITEKEALEGGRHNSFSFDEIEVEAVLAENKNHNPKECVGYMLTVNGIKIYAAGDTSKHKHMEAYPARNLDYALLPCDGVYNMDIEEATECARLIGAKHNIPIHMSPGKLFDKKRAEEFGAPNKLVLEPGCEIML